MVKIQMRAYKEVLKEMEFLEYGPKEPEMEPIENCLESVEDISWESDLIRKYMKEYLGVRLWNCLTVLTDTELQVVYAKVYRQLTFAEIGNILREKPGKIADTYSYARKKIKRNMCFLSSISADSSEKSGGTVKAGGRRNRPLPESENTVV